MCLFCTLDYQLNGTHCWRADAKLEARITRMYTARHKFIEKSPLGGLTPLANHTPGMRFEVVDWNSHRFSLQNIQKGPLHQVCVKCIYPNDWGEKRASSQTAVSPQYTLLAIINFLTRMIKVELSSICQRLLKSSEVTVERVLAHCNHPLMV